jgi:amino acid transporter
MAQTDSNKISLATATIIGMNAMIGAGIFAAPAAVAAHAGPAGILACIFVVFSVWFMANAMARLAYLFPQEGSFYLYAKQWSGHLGGMIAVSAYFVGLLIALGLLCHMGGFYLQPFFPSMSANTLGLVVLAAFILLNLYGVTCSQLGQQILICCTVFPLLATTIACLSKADWHNLIPFAPHGLGNIMKATRVVIFSFFGFECASSLFNIVKEPIKNVPRALTYSIIIVGTIYTLFIGSIILATPASFFVDQNVRASEILAYLFPGNSWILHLVDISILSAIFGTIHSMIWACSNLLTTIVKHVQNKRVAAFVNAGKFKDYHAVLFVGFWILMSYLLLENINLFFYFTAIFLVFSFVMSMITLLTIPSEWKNHQNIKTIFGIITATAIFLFAIEGVVCELLNLTHHGC